MTTSEAGRVAKWLIWDTYRQAMATSVFYFVSLGILVAVLFCLSISIDGPTQLRRPGEAPEFYPRDFAHSGLNEAEKTWVDHVHGQVHFAFGAFRVDLGRDAHDAVRFLHTILAGVVADAVGVLLALVWTAGFMPQFLEPNAATVLLAKPVPRWGLLLGKYVGVVSFVCLQAAVFLLATWGALGLRTGIWDPRYFAALPWLALHFAVFYAFSTMLAVATRSTMACFFGTIAFWFLCWGVNYGRHALQVVPNLPEPHPVLATMLEAGYWMLPKPVDVGLLLFDSIDAGNFFGGLKEFATLQESGVFSPLLATVSCVGFLVVMLGLAGYELQTKDY